MRLLHKNAFLGFLRSVLANPKTLQPRDTSSEPILCISWSGSDVQICFGPCRKGAAWGRLQPPCGVGRNKSECQTQTMKCSECVQRTCLWVVQFLDWPKRTSGSRETRLCAKSAPKAPQERKGLKVWGLGFNGSHSLSQMMGLAKENTSGGVKAD